MLHSAMDIGTVVLGLALCGMATLFNQLGKITIVSILLIVVIDLGCGLMLLSSPMGLDGGNLPVFDVLLVSELIAVSLLPAIMVFPVALRAIAWADRAEEIARLQRREAELLNREAARTLQLA